MIYNRRIDPLLGPITGVEDTWKLVVPAEHRAQILTNAWDGPRRRHPHAHQTASRIRGSAQQGGCCLEASDRCHGINMISSPGPASIVGGGDTRSLCVAKPRAPSATIVAGRGSHSATARSAERSTQSTCVSRKTHGGVKHQQWELHGHRGDERLPHHPPHSAQWGKMDKIL